MIEMTKSKVSISDLFREHLQLPNRGCIANIRQLKNGDERHLESLIGLSCCDYAMRVDGKYYVTDKGQKTLDDFDRYKKQNILVRAIVIIALAAYILHPDLFVGYALILGVLSLFFGAYFAIASLLCLCAYYIFGRDHRAMRWLMKGRK